MLPGERVNSPRPMFTAEELADSMVRNYGGTKHGVGRGDIPDNMKNWELTMVKLPLEFYAGEKAIRGLGWLGKKGFQQLPEPARDKILGGIQSLKTNVKDVMGTSLRKSQPDIDEVIAMRKGANQFLPKPKNVPHPDIIPGVSGASVSEIFVNKPSYHGTKDPIIFERMGTKTNELGIEVPSRGQTKKSPSFSVSSDYHLAKEFTENPLYSMTKDKDYATQKWNPRVIPTVLDKKYSNKILDYRNPKHRDLIAKEYKMEREKMKKDLFKKDGTLRNDRVIAEKKAAFDKVTLDNIKDLNNWEKTNWQVMETIQDNIIERGWKGYTTTEKGILNLQVLDGRMIRGVRDKDTGEIMYSTAKPLKELEDGGPVREGITALPKPVNLRKKQVTQVKPSKSLKKQGFNKETRLKAQYKNVSYFG